MFGRCKSQLSRIINWMFVFISENFGHLMENTNMFWLEPEYLQMYSNAISAKGAALTNCVGFIDGKKIPRNI